MRRTAGRIALAVFAGVFVVAPPGATANDRQFDRRLRRLAGSRAASSFPKAPKRAGVEPRDPAASPTGLLSRGHGGCALPNAGRRCRTGAVWPSGRPGGAASWARDGTWLAVADKPAQASPSRIVGVDFRTLG